MTSSSTAIPVAFKSSILTNLLILLLKRLLLSGTYRRLEGVESAGYYFLLEGVDSPVMIIYGLKLSGLTSSSPSSSSSWLSYNKLKCLHWNLPHHPHPLHRHQFALTIK